MPILLLLALAVGCTAPSDGAARPDSDSPAAGADFAATLEVAERVGTVATVRFETPEPAARAWVEVQEPGGPVRRFPAQSDADGTRHTAVLAGLAAATDHAWRALAEDADGAQTASADAVFETEPPPLWLPDLVQPVPASDPWAPGFVLTTLLGNTAGAAVFDRQGRYVWWWEPEDGQMPCQARLGLDGRSITLMTVDLDMVDDVAAVRRIELDGTERESFRVSLGHHDFLERDDGVIGFLSFDMRPVDGHTVVGDRLVLLDTASLNETELWSTWDDLEFVPGQSEWNYPFGEDWTHGNGLAYDAAADEWLVSLHNLDALMRVSAEGEVLWRLGGPGDDFTWIGGEPFQLQHSPLLTDAGVLLFDNHSPDPARLYSRAAEYRLDLDARTAEEIWSYDGDQDLYTAFMGAVERTPEGTTIIGWGSAGRMTEVDADGTVLWQVETSVGNAFGFTRPLTTLGEESP